MSFSSGKNAWGISDRSGRRYRLREMKKEWTGSLVGPDEYESKHPQLFPPRISPDPQALQNARPDRKEPAVEVLLQKNPFSVTSGFGVRTLTIKVFEPSHGRETGDTVRFRKAQGFGVVTSARLNDSDGHTITKIDADNYSFTVASENPFAKYEQLQYSTETFQATMISKDIPLGNAQIGGGQGPRYQKQYDLWYSNTHYSSGELGLVYPSGRYSSQFTLPFQQWWTPDGGFLPARGEANTVFSSDQYGGDTGGETNSGWLFHVWYADNWTDPKTPGYTTTAPPYNPFNPGYIWQAESASGDNVYTNSKYADVVTYIEGTMLPFMVSNLDIYGEYFTTTTLKGGGTVASAGPVTVEA